MITNKKKNKIICTNKKILTNILSKAIGLMFSKKINDTGYIFVFRNPMRIDLHMFFVFFPIDVIFLDENKRVVELKENFRPFSIYVSKEKVKYVIELPEKAIKEGKIEIGDKMEF